MGLGLSCAKKTGCVSGEVVRVDPGQLRSEHCKGHVEEGHLNTVTKYVV